ncbi:origin recognition complex subunit 4 C-terminus-domain-containing protein [Pisolithus thermaeus]|nr:origin recognition complex subunit 4 C-terminus-domain-containing protein [Pisolithus croceorrhizus]KAI6164889.1 origin recognition complex subunit 4 C-terminus-domain-containing protein [Pisolithus thermaeus]
MPKRKAPEDHNTVTQPSPPKRTLHHKSSRPAVKPSQSDVASENVLAPEQCMHVEVPATPRVRRGKRARPGDDSALQVSGDSPKDSAAKRKLRGEHQGNSPPRPPQSLPQVLPAHLTASLRLQQRATLASLQTPNPFAEEDNDVPPSANVTASRQLQDLLFGSVTRGEGNSCLLLGPRGSGKTKIVEQAIESLSLQPIIVRLSGHAQHNDRLALREIARQLSLQTGRSFLNDNDIVDEDHSLFSEPIPPVPLPPPSHLPALVSLLPTLSRPTIVILDAFDLFALHARQSLLYCLLDTVQSCRVGQGSNGLAVVGVTSRLDAINLLEKRVKSRFSGRVLRTAPPVKLCHWMSLSRRLLCIPIEKGGEEWMDMWNLAVDTFLADRKVAEVFADTFALTRDVRMLQNLLVGVVAELRPSSPFPTLSKLTSVLAAHRGAHFLDPYTLSYPSICLLIATMHAQIAGHDQVTFEMLYEMFREQLRASAAAPIQIEGGSIGMVRCTREVLMTSFERLLAAGMFLGVAPPSVNTAPEFVRYRCLVERELLKRVVDTAGQTSLKKWFYKAS